MTGSARREIGGSFRVPGSLCPVLLWPALVTLSNGSQFSACKVYGTAETGTDVWVWDVPSQTAVILVHGPGLPITDGRDQYTLTVDDGTDAHVVVDARDCGCSHPLKRFRPTSGAIVQHAGG